MNNIIICVLYLMFFIVELSIGQSYNEKLKRAEQIQDTDPQQSVLLLNEVLLADSLEVPPLVRARTLQLLGLGEMYNNQFDKASHYFKRSEDLYPHILPGKETTNQKASLAMDIGRSFTWQAKYDSALHKFLLAKKLYEKTGDKKGLATTLNAIAVVYGQFSEDYPAALKAFKEALQINKQLNDSLSMAKVMQNIGQIYELTGQLDSALYFLQVSNALSERFNDHRSLAVGSNIIGAVFFALNNLDSSEFYYRKAIKLDIQNQDSIGLVLDYHMLSLTLIEKKEYQEAKRYALNAFQFAKDLGVKYETAKNLSKIYELTYNHKKALAFHQEYKKLEDSLRSEGQRQIISELQTKYDTEAKEQEIALLDQKNKLASIELAAANKEKSYYLIIAILIFIVAGSLFIVYQQRSKANQLLAQKNAQLSQLNATKDRLFGVVAHDLKNPLSAFNSITQSMIDNQSSISEEDLKYFLEKLFKSSKELNGLLQNLLEWSMSQSGEISYRPENLQVKHLIDAAIEPLRLNLDIKQIHFSMEADENIYITSDKKMTLTVLRNLLSNAIKFTPTEGSISVKVYENRDNVIIEVTDTGIGIESRDLNKIFHHGTDYNQIGNSTEKGTGLGLVLCKELIEKQSGKITVESQLGKGSTFAIALSKADVLLEVDLIA